ncbi:hypothetical protein MIMGU_mgv1a023093mg [Erythranthe guttata]|uniref:Uncharacterized protein n=1 Tax=Erythranthe guttata TaxID=4155 RepID=A0A022R2P4_ERYGU|nr:hypothetical protein MIMGU_mgv1a023093mg [Erythranthe guttata]
MRIKVLVLYFVFLRTLLRMHFCASVVWLCNDVANALLRMFFYLTFVHVHLSECVCACLLICINVLGL